MAREIPNRYRSKTDAELDYIIRDAGEAAQAMRGHDPIAEAKYADQVNDACTERYRRNQRAWKSTRRN